MMIVPMAEPCQKGETPIRFRPLRIITMISTPISVPMIEPRPPIEAGAADHHGGDGVELQRVARQRVGREELRDREGDRDGGERAGHDIGQDASRRAR